MSANQNSGRPIPRREIIEKMTSLKPPPRKLGERNELVMMSSGLSGLLIFMAILMFMGKDNLINVLGFRFGNEAPGVLVGEEQTWLNGEDVDVWKYFYTYTFEGKQYEGFSYSRKNIPEKPTIEVSRWNPGLSRIKGATYAFWGAVGFWVMVVPLFLCIPGLWTTVSSRLRNRSLLIHGQVVDARLSDMKETKGQHDSVSRELTYTVRLPDGSTKEHKFTSFMRNYEQHTKILYNTKTGRMLQPYQLVHLPDIDNEGNFENPSVKRYFKSALWLAGGFLLFAIAVFNITLSFTGI